jgi:endonuclease/exonuclease/phosphatase family metal-dependent hydrolase
MGGLDQTILRYLTVVVLCCAALLASSPIFAGGSFRIVSQNMHRFFDNVDDGNNEQQLSDASFNQKVKKTALKISDDFKLPNIVALQEVENRNLLAQVAAAVYARSGVGYQVIIREGNDISGINLAYLVKQGTKIKSVKQLFQFERLAYDGSLLFSRPPLYLEACLESRCLSIVNLHLRSMLGIRSNSGGERVRRKRHDQAAKIARWIEHFQQSRPHDSLMVLGDFNALTPSDRHVDVAGAILGKPDNANVKVPVRDWINDDLIDLTRQIPQARRYSYIYRKNKQILDYMFVNAAFGPSLENIEFTRIEYQFSDHAGLIAEFNW